MAISIRLENHRTIPRFIGKTPRIARELLVEAMDDIADKVEERSRQLAPRGATGRLREHPVDRSDIKVGTLTRIPSFGGGFAVRGDAGGFVFGGVTGNAGQLVARSVITVAEQPEHAKWVHGGTGLFGPHRTPIVSRTPGKLLVFIGRRGKVATLSVRGQRPQPYLEDAFFEVDRDYVPLRLERLQRAINALT